MGQRPNLLANVNYAWLAIIAAFLAANLTYIYYEAFGAGSSMDVPGRLAERLAEAIPAIRTPVSYLEQHGAADRAAIVRNIYVFNWASAVSAWIAMATLALLCVAASSRWRARSRDDVAAAQAPAPERSRYLAEGGVAMIAALLVFCLTYAIFGDFSPDNYSRYSNMVHVRDRDFFLLLFYLLMSLLFSMLFLALGVKWLVNNKSAASSKPAAPIDHS